MGYNPPKVKRHFPSLCDKIASRYWQYVENRHPSPSGVRKVFRAALKQQPPPSLQRVLRLLGCRDTGYYYYYNYRDLCLSVTHRYKEHRNKPFNKDADGKRLQATLTEQPPPSFSEVAKRLGHTREFIRKKFPELSKAVVSRYLHYQTALRKETAERLRHAIRVAAQEIVVSGQYVSEARVRERLRQRLPKLGRDILFKQALREVKLELGITK
jgi:hypothetical protein